MTNQHIDLEQIMGNASLFHNQPCIYYLINEKEEVIYVGKTQNLYSQLLSHRLTGKNFARFSFLTCNEEDLDSLEKEAISQFRPALNSPPVQTTQPLSKCLSKQLICLKHNITPVAFEHLRKAFGLEPISAYGNTKYYRPEDVEAWLKRFKGLVVRGGTFYRQARST